MMMVPYRQINMVLLARLSGLLPVGFNLTAYTVWATVLLQELGHLLPTRS